MLQAISSLLSCYKFIQNISIKISKFPIKLENSYFWPILLLYLHVKSQKIKCISLLSKLKNSFWAPFCPKTQYKIFPQKIIWISLKSYAAVTSSKKSENFHTLTFHKTWKTLFWVSFGPQTSKQSFSPKKKTIRVNFKPIVNLCKNIRNIFECQVFTKFEKPYLGFVSEPITFFPSWVKKTFGSFLQYVTILNLVTGPFSWSVNLFSLSRTRSYASYFTQ